MLTKNSPELLSNATPAPFLSSLPTTPKTGTLPPISTHSLTPGSCLSTRLSNSISPVPPPPTTSTKQNSVRVA